MTGQAGFFDFEDRLKELSAEGDPLEKLTATVDFEIFRPVLTKALGPRDPAKGGRPPFDLVLKFKMLVLQSLHGLSLAQTSYMLRFRSWTPVCLMSGIEGRADDAMKLRAFIMCQIR